VYDAHLGHIGVLELVNHDVLVFFLKIKPQVVKYFHAVNHSQDHIVKIIQLGFFHPSQVLLVDRADRSQL